MVLKRLYQYRFELFFFSLVLILFGSLIFPKYILNTLVMPVLFFINIASGLVIFKKRRKQSIIVRVILFATIGVFLYRYFLSSEEHVLEYVRFFIYFIFYSITTFEIISQVWKAKKVNKTVIYGLMSGYIALGLIGFFIFNCIELINPGSFSGLQETGMTPKNIDDLMYYSYITLMTVGYGDISPITDISQKASMLIAMVGQFYLVIITAVVVEKYIRHSQKTNF